MRPLATTVLAISALTACGPSAPATSSQPGPPNIVIIMADDMGWGDIQPYGQEKIQTPNLARMAAEGTRFTAFYAGSTVCAPSRSVLLTGQHTGHTPIRGNREVLPIGQAPLPAEAVTLAEVLKDRGYATGVFGKWGLGAPESEGIPTRQGFDEFFGYLDQRRAHFYYPEFLWHNETRVPLPNRTEPAPNTVGAGRALEKGEYSHDRIATEALEFIDEHRDGPFFLYVPFTIPHAELAAPEDAFAPYLDADGNSIFPETPFPGEHYGPQPMPHAAYAAMISRMDRDVGRILDRLREYGLAENTIVLFTSDNGPSVEGGSDPDFFASSGPFRGRKRDLYEGGIRVPMIAWGPGRIPAGAESDQVWAMWDIFPTVAELAGASVPDEVDGLSMVAALTGEGEAPEHDYLYWEFYERGSAQAARMGDWKAVRQPMLSGEIELYNLATDPRESQDLAASHPDLVQRFLEIMEEAHTPSPMWEVPS
ncbi:MAG TPA: arylsulfatase [Longimicrobiaceae bacterium]